MESQTRKLAWGLILPLALLTIAVWIAVSQSTSDLKLHIVFYEGGGTFIRTAAGSKVIMDGGPTESLLQNLGKSLPYSDRTVELVVVTSTKDDSVGGLVEVLKRYQVKNILLPDEQAGSGLYQELNRLADEKHVQKIYAQAGQRIWLDSSTMLDLFDPVDLRLNFGASRILFLNSSEANVAQFQTHAQLIKIALPMVSAEFLQQLAPTFAVLQVDTKTYSTKFADLIANLHAVNVQIYRTDQDRTVEFVSEGTNLAKK